MTVYDFREKHYEIINGEKILFGSSTFAHSLINGNLLMLFGLHVMKNKSGFILNQLYTYLPDMVAEIFSRSTMKRDFTIKKDIYERNGVKEYWLINPWSESIEVYLLRDGKYFLDDVYQNYSDKDLKALTDEERAEVKFEIPVAVLDGFKVKIKNIFGRYFE